MSAHAGFSSILVLFLIISAYALYRALRKRSRGAAFRAAPGRLSRHVVIAAYELTPPLKIWRRFTSHLDVALPAAALVIGLSSVMSVNSAAYWDLRVSELEARAREMGLHTAPK